MKETLEKNMHFPPETLGKVLGIKVEVKKQNRKLKEAEALVTMGKGVDRFPMWKSEQRTNRMLAWVNDGPSYMC